MVPAELVGLGLGKAKVAQMVAGAAETAGLVKAALMEVAGAAMVERTSPAHHRHQDCFDRTCPGYRQCMQGIRRWRILR